MARLVIKESNNSIEPNSITSHLATFHGSDRGDEPRAFINLDMVLTTYSTLVKDHQNAGVLHRLKWFRIILDEGKIRQEFRPKGNHASQQRC
jgi:SNF2 family DNA or RNA helicase